MGSKKFHFASALTGDGWQNDVTVAVDTAGMIRTMLASNKLPPPVNDARCKECSMNGICQPTAFVNTTRLKQLRDELFKPEA